MTRLRGISFEEYLSLNDGEKERLENDLRSDLKVLEDFKKTEFKIREKARSDKFRKDILELYEDVYFHFSNYENFSVHNYANILKPSFKHSTGYLAFFSETELPEIEEFGLISLIKKCFEHYDSFDIALHVYKGIYNSDKDKVSPICNSFYHDTFSNIYFVSEHIRHNRLNLKDKMYVYYVRYNTEYRTNKTTLWKKLNPRQFDITTFRKEWQ